MAIAETLERRPLRIGLTGHGAILSPIGSSLEIEAARRRMRLRLRRFDQGARGGRAHLRALIEAVRSEGYDLLHCADPLRRELTELIHDSAVIADRSQLYDTVYLDETGSLQGYDAGTLGLQDALRDFLKDRAAEHVLILGGGSEAQSAALALVGLGVKRLTFHDPDLSRAASLANLMQQRDGIRCTLLASLEGVFHEFSRPGMTRGWIDGVIHAPAQERGAGVHGIQQLAPPLWLADLAPPDTASGLGRQARAEGCALLTAEETCRHRGTRLLTCALQREADRAAASAAEIAPERAAEPSRAMAAQEALRSG